MATNLAAPRESVKKILDCNAKIQMQTECLSGAVLLKRIDGNENAALNEKLGEYLVEVSMRLEEFVRSYAE